MIQIFQSFHPLIYTQNNLSLFSIFLILSYLIVIFGFFLYINLIKICIQRKELEKRKIQLYLLRVILEILPIIVIPYIGKIYNIKIILIRN